MVASFTLESVWIVYASEVHASLNCGYRVNPPQAETV